MSTSPCPRTTCTRCRRLIARMPMPNQSHRRRARQTGPGVLLRQNGLTRHTLLSMHTSCQKLCSSASWHTHKAADFSLIPCSCVQACAAGRKCWPGSGACLSSARRQGPRGRQQVQAFRRLLQVGLTQVMKRHASCIQGAELNNKGVWGLCPPFSLS